MNHRNAMPANGTRFSASATVAEFFSSHAPASSGSDGTERRKSTKLVIGRSAKTIPAMAAARGARSCAAVKVACARMPSFPEGIVPRCPTDADTSIQTRLPLVPHPGCGGWLSHREQR